MTTRSPRLFRAVACTATASAALLLPGTAATAAGPVALSGATLVTTGGPADGVGQIVVKLHPGADVDHVNAVMGSRTESVVLASRLIYLLDVPFTVDPKAAADPKRLREAWKAQAAKLTQQATKLPEVIYAEANDAYDTGDTVSGSWFHHWPDGAATCTSADPAEAGYLTQNAATELDLSAAHGLSTGDGTVIAVLDTGLDATHSLLADRVMPGGYDYVDDDADPAEVRAGTDSNLDGLPDTAYGHGTFVAGVAALVAPGARILPERVLDSDGRGTVFTVAEAIFDATAAGADVINMSFGTADPQQSRVLADAIKSARHDGAVIVAAAGNDSSTVKHFPAAYDHVVSVAALDATGTALADYSARGAWVAVAAPGTDIVSALPCGYGTWSGTSMAAPVVSGQAALVISEQRSGRVKKSDVYTRVTGTSDKLHGVSVGHGAVDPLRSLTP